MKDGDGPPSRLWGIGSGVPASSKVSDSLERTYGETEEMDAGLWESGGCQGAVVRPPVGLASSPTPNSSRLSLSPGAQPPLVSLLDSRDLGHIIQGLCLHH